MKFKNKSSLIYAFSLIGLLFILIFGCKKEDLAELAKLGSLSVSEITTSSVKVAAMVENSGGVNVNSRGLVWGTSENPDIESYGGRTAVGSGTGEFVTTITGLSPSTKYYLRAWATNSEGTAYSSQVEFITLAGTAAVTTAEVTGITEDSAVSGGEVTDDGGVEVTARGVVWSTTEEPDIEENDGITEDGNGSGEFTSELTGLSPATTYYVRAYATNSEGTVYGNQVEFTTLAGTAAVTTAEVTGITEDSAVSGGEVTDDGGVEVTARGVVWSIAEEPDIDGNDGITEDGNGSGEFTSELTGLLPATTYYVRAYATNSAGTVYGNQVEFTTLAGLPEVTTAAVADITDNTAVAGGNVESDGGAQVTARGVVWSTFQDPSLENNEGMMNEGTGIGEFSVGIKGLSPETTYYVRAFATNSEGTVYGDQVEFTTYDYPEVSTELVTGITDVSASVRGRVMADGGATTYRGIVWSTSENPTLEINEGMTIDGTGTGFFTGNVPDLNTGTIYFARAWAENNVGVSYGEQVEFTTYDGRAVDIEENIYYYVITGKQEWMVSNLKTTSLSDGTGIQEVTVDSDWNDMTNPAYCWYENYGEKFKDVFGALYNWYTVETEKLCPEGWRVPTTGDLSELIKYLGAMETAGGKLKGTAYWQDPNTGASDEIRFNALPAGIRFGMVGNSPGEFYGLNLTTAWWTSTPYEIGAYIYGVNNQSAQLFAEDQPKDFGVSVRCMRGDPPADPPMYIAPW